MICRLLSSKLYFGYSSHQRYLLYLSFFTHLLDNDELTCAYFRTKLTKNSNGKRIATHDEEGAFCRWAALFLQFSDLRKIMKTRFHPIKCMKCSSLGLVIVLFWCIFYNYVTPLLSLNSWPYQWVSLSMNIANEGSVWLLLWQVKNKEKGNEREIEN